MKKNVKISNVSRFNILIDEVKNRGGFNFFSEENCIVQGGSLDIDP